MKQHRSVASAVLFALALAACSGGGATVGPGTGAAPAAPGASPAATPTAAPTGSAQQSFAKVGTGGNEPVLTEAPDGTLYISALTNLYRSEDGGKTWTLLAGPTIAATVLASDSSIDVAPNGRLFYTFDYPYAGTTAVCTSDDKGNTWACDNAVVPGGTDRMWVTSPGNSEAYETTNEGLYQTAFLQSSDGGTTWVPQQMGDQVTQPDTGPLTKVLGSSVVLQVNDLHPGREVYRYLVNGLGVPQLANIVNTGLASGVALPGSGQDTAGNYYAVGEPPTKAGGLAIQVARSTDQGQTFTLLPPIPQTLIGTSTFTWVTAGKPGHVAVLFYFTPVNGTDPTSMNVPWTAKVAETYDAFDNVPVWTVTTLEPLVHTGSVCANIGGSTAGAADCRYSGDFISAVIDKDEHLNMTWMDEPPNPTPSASPIPTIRFERMH
jgi:hypothetical protein